MSVGYVDVLLVEDHPEDARLILHALGKHGLVHAPHVIGDGGEALDFLFCRGRYADREFGVPPKLVLLDLSLPGVGGLEILRQLRADPRTATLPVVALTSSEEENDRLEGYRLGVNAYVVKPVDVSQFEAALHRAGAFWLRRNQLPHPQ